MMSAEMPAYWNASMPGLVMRREPMSGVDDLQTTYVRYEVRGEEEAKATSTGWTLPESLEAQDSYPPDNLPSARDVAPASVFMRIATAPAEYAVPVKQDKRLTPDFKVRMEVRYQKRVRFDVEVRAHVISQEEYDNMNAWLPDDLSPESPTRMIEKRHPTELKGTTAVRHVFSAVLAAQQQAMSNQQTRANMSSSGELLQIAQELGLLSSGEMCTVKQPQDDKGVAGLSAMMQGGHYGGAMTSQPLMQGGGMGEAEQEGAQIAGLEFPTTLHRGGPGSRQGSLTDAMVLEHPGSILESNHAPMVEQTLGGDGEATLVRDFDFTNVEFVKPTRMGKVYMVFSALVLNRDLLYCVYEVPTIGICRAEQKKKAYQKLGIPYSDNNEHHYGVGPVPAAPPVSPYMDGGGLFGADGVMSGGKRGRHDAMTSLPHLMATQDLLAGNRFGGGRGCGFAGGPAGVPQAKSSVARSGVTLHGGADHLAGDMPPHSRQVLRDWILEEYEHTSLSRRLTEQDLRALESQAGFPPDSGQMDQLSIRPEQWQDFQASFLAVLQLLKRIQPLWNQDDPCIISGFDMDRRMALQALTMEPPGTFICRFSMSQPGCLVMTCKVPPKTANADPDNLIHALIRVDDLQERRVDTWIRDFPGASHVLDVYKNKRVDKRKVFASHYTRLRHLEAFDG